MSENAVVAEATETLKKDWQSSTVWGAIIMALSLLVEMIWGVEIDAEAQTAVTNNIVAVISSIMGLVGGVTTVVGRAKASGPTELSLFKVLRYLPGVLTAINKAKNAATESSTAMVLFLAPVSLLALTASPALAGDGVMASGLDLVSQSAWPAVINFGYVVAGIVMLLLLYRFVFDPWLIIPGWSTMNLIREGSLPTAVFAGLIFLGMAVMVGLVLG